MRYVIDRNFPSSQVIPKNKNPVGLVISVESVLVGRDPEHQAHIEIVEVIWSIPSWNNDEGLSMECPSDLFLIQRVTDPIYSVA